MIVRIASVEALEDFVLLVKFDDNTVVQYDMKDDINALPGYVDLRVIEGLWMQVRLDESRTCVYWNDYIDLPSDILYEYGIKI
ncbi:MAG: DUF2442 domain-containing protein [Lachnospiraceae bacterium]|nr:DUF2442 domain-containing protein [Lachnospiraceae bacterium]